jgi:lipoate synthase
LRGDVEISSVTRPDLDRGATRYVEQASKIGRPKKNYKVVVLVK